MHSTCASIMFLYLIRNTANQISNPLANSLARYNGVRFPKIKWNNQDVCVIYNGKIHRYEICANAHRCSAGKIVISTKFAIQI